MDRTKQDPLSHTKEPNQTEQITLEDLERKLAASSINSETLTVDPAQFLSINLVDKDQKETASHKLETNKNQESTASPSELPIVNYDCDTEDLSLFFAPPDATATTTESDLDSYGIDIDIEPLPIAFSRSNRYEETNSLLDPSEYQHIFDEEYLAAFIQEIQDQEEPKDMGIFD
jgi:hypothetical protein